MHTDCLLIFGTRYFSKFIFIFIPSFLTIFCWISPGSFQMSCLRKIGSRLFHTSAKLAADGEFCKVTKDMEKYLTCRKDVKLEVCLMDDEMVNPCWDKPCVVIVGAGIAGLAAAQRLISCGITDVTVLEATDRPGGRIHSCWMGDNIVEVGADHIEGASISNGAYALAAIEGLFDPPVTPRTQTEGLAFTSTGELICPFVTRAATYTFNAIIDKTRSLFKIGENGMQCGSLCEYVSKEIERNIALYPCKYRAHAAQVMISRLIDLKSKIGADLNDVSASHFGTKEDLAGGDVRVRSGMVGILASSLRGMADCGTVRYCKPVDKIAWRNTCGRPRAKVFCCDGDMFCADYVILTPSLGVMKEKAQTMFEPPLPNDKLEAINTMGFGNINHLYLEYDQPFWVWNEGNMLLAWNYDELTDGSCCWLTGIGSMSEVPYSQQIMQVTVAGTRADHIESTDDVSLAEDVTRMYRHFFKNPSIPYPANVLKSKWKESPYFRGSRSYLNLNTTARTQCDLSKPVPECCGKEFPVLLFAGEHTSIGEYGTIHGARTSGIREAQRILELTKNLQGAPAVLEPRDVDEERARGCV